MEIAPLERVDYIAPAHRLGIKDRYKRKIEMFIKNWEKNVKIQEFFPGKIEKNLRNITYTSSGNIRKEKGLFWDGVY